jgi:hypothetical protein
VTEPRRVQAVWAPDVGAWLVEVWVQPSGAPARLLRVTRHADRHEAEQEATRLRTALSTPTTKDSP